MENQPTIDETWSPATIQAVVKDYEEGLKLRTIEQKYWITRSIIYRILRNADVAPTRVKQRSRDNIGDSEQTTTMLFRLVEQQDKRIVQLENFIQLLGAEIPKPVV
jgi:hypothetical protein